MVKRLESVEDIDSWYNPNYCPDNPYDSLEPDFEMLFESLAVDSAAIRDWLEQWLMVNTVEHGEEFDQEICLAFGIMLGVRLAFRV